MPTVERVGFHVFVEGPLHGQCWNLEQLLHLGAQIDQYAFYYREVVTGSLSRKRAFVWRYVGS